MKYQVGDDILVLLSNEEGKVIEIINDKMVLIEVRGVKFPAYMDQIDFPYFKMFSEKRIVEKKKIFIDNVKQEKGVMKMNERNRRMARGAPAHNMIRHCDPSALHEQ